MNAFNLILLAGGLAVGGMFLYSFYKDQQDPFGYLSDLFSKYADDPVERLSDAFNDTFVEGGKSIVPKSLRESGSIKPRNLDFHKPSFDTDYFN